MLVPQGPIKTILVIRIKITFSSKLLKSIIEIKTIKIITMIPLKIKSFRTLNTIIKNLLKKASSPKKRLITFLLNLLKKYIKNIR